MANEKILVIDDDIDHLRLYRLILEKNGYRVRTLSKTKEALDATIIFKPDLVFMDHFMPDTSDIEITIPDHYC
jgi:CheY-like chemotaxis protein